MDTKTLMDVVAMIDARLSKEDLNLEWAHDDNPDFHESMPEYKYNFILGQRFGLNELREYLQLAIDADVASIESNTGE
jgi:hypothetical protein